MDVDLTARPGPGAPAQPMARAPRIGVFDSGLGGLTVHAEVQRQIPGAELIYVADDAGFPYGPLPGDVLVERVLAVLDPVITSQRLDLVVVACNTASTLALPALRERFSIPFVGTVPAVKPAAAASRSRRISVLATAGTVARDYTRDLINAHAADCEVTLVGSPVLAPYAEAVLRGEAIADADIRNAIAPAFVEDAGGRTDVVVLACTHYPLLLDRFRRLAPWDVTWIDSAQAIARRAAALIGPVKDGCPVRPPRALFTADRPCPPALRAALTARGFVQTAVLPVPLAPRAVAC